MAVDDWLRAAKTRVVEAVEQSIAETASKAAQMVQELTPANRRLTIQSVRHKMTGRRSAVVGLFFSRRFRNRTNTPTHQHFRSVWRRIRPRVAKHMVAVMNKKL